MTYVNPEIKRIGPGKILAAFGVNFSDRFLRLPGDLFSHDEAAAIIDGLGLEITPEEMSEEYIHAGILRDITYSLQKVNGGYQMTCTEEAKGGILLSNDCQAIKC
jgi:hypothetical protein